MIITLIEKNKRNRYCIYGEEGYLFSLYGKEIKKYNIIQDEPLDDSLISEIYDEVIFKRAKERALYLLDRRPYTVAKLREKLTRDRIPDFIIDKVMDFLDEYHYVDDNAYVLMYIQSYSGKKSRRQIVSDLISKGIDKQMIDTCFSEGEYTELSERECFINQYRKYTKGKDLTDINVRNKVFRYFYSKGFSASLIKDLIENNY